MSTQRQKYSVSTVREIAALMAVKSPTDVNYLKGPQLVDIFRNLGFDDFYNFSSGIGIQTSDIGFNLSRGDYTFKRLTALNDTFRLPEALQKFTESVPNALSAATAISRIIERCKPSLSLGTSINANEALKPKSSHLSEEYLTLQNFCNPQSDGSITMESKLGINNITSQLLGDIPNDRKVVFISYSWDSEEHKKWVKKFADALTDKGIYILLDQYVSSGVSLPLFMMHGIQTAYKVLVIGTKNYVQKMMQIGSGAGFEGSIITSALFENIATNKFIPCLRSGDFNESFPSLIKDCKGFDFRNDDRFEQELDSLSREIWGCSKNQRPKLGDIPDYAK